MRCSDPEVEAAPVRLHAPPASPTRRAEPVDARIPRRLLSGDCAAKRTTSTSEPRARETPRGTR